MTDLNRASLKTKAKAVLKRSYWKSLLVALIIAMVSGQLLSICFTAKVTPRSIARAANAHERVRDISLSEFDDAFFERINDKDLKGLSIAIRDVAQRIDANGVTEWRAIGEEIEQYIESNPSLREKLLGIAIVIAVVISIVVLVILICSALIYIFLGAPLDVGLRRFYTQSTFKDEEVGAVGYAFRNGYGNVVKTMFTCKLYVILWSMIPIVGWAIAIYKEYGYRMVPFILADNPHMSTKRALMLSEQMMKGRRFELFVLELSFIGWGLLCILTAGIGFLFLAPYVYATEAQFYMAVSGEAVKNGWVSREEMNLPAVGREVEDEGLAVN